MKNAPKWLAAVAVLLVLIVPLSIKKSRDASGLEVNVVQAQTRVLNPTILASGTLAYETEVSLTAEVLARVSQVLVEEGDSVEFGQLLLKLDPETYNNAISREGAGLRQSRNSILRKRDALHLKEKQIARSQALARAQLIDQNSLDELLDQLSAARSDLADSEEALRRSEAIVGEAYEQRAKTEIRSPLAGTIISTSIKVGETAIPSTSALAGAQLMRIADTSTIQAELKVDEADIGKVTIGQAVQVTPSAFPHLTLEGAVEKIALDPTIEGLGRAYKVTTTLTTAPSVHLRSGMSVRADIQLGDGTERLAVPVEAVVSEADERGSVVRYVWIVEGRAARKRVVETSGSDDRWEEVTRGLVAGDQVITGPARTLRALIDGERIAPKLSEQKVAGNSSVASTR
ncbi:efflux RND transporter periplasmic adaptor subunit [Luteimonas sp. FCS-9]|uniref:efflux RND transporter periplasmic adaptor subunit n=1 Tax=Luteimonas sp. FCS-9 TaxID=1547516 RepID=UPI0009E3D7C9|nr:efflux RND transporter periplasmic adaptor subunit [Luteimonas sp. FCS-9]